MATVLLGAPATGDQWKEKKRRRTKEENER
jgi:hypothetical protein